MAESTLMVNDLTSVEMTGDDPSAGFRAGQNWSAIYKMASGRRVNITIDVTNNGGFETITDAMGRTDLRDDPRFAEIESRITQRAALEGLVAEWVATFQTAAEVEAAIENSAVLAAEVRTVPELAATEWARERGAFVEVDTGRGQTVTVPQSPWRFGMAETGAGTNAGYRGQDNRTVLAGMLGLSEGDLDALERDGVISSRPPRWATN